MESIKHGTRALCKTCGQDVEFVGAWRDRGGNRACVPYMKDGEIVTPPADATHDVNPLDVMTWEQWQKLLPPERDRLRDLSELTPQLKGLEGWRVEVRTTYGETRRFIVGKSTGWKPIHLEIARRNCYGGPGAEKEYKNVKRLYQVR